MIDFIGAIPILIVLFIIISKRKISFFFFFTVVFWTDVQQSEFHIGMQEQRRMRDQQEEQDVVQSVQTAQMSFGRHV